MHTEWDTTTRDNTLALYGVKPRRSRLFHSPAYYALRTVARAAVIFLPILGIHALAYTLIPA